MLTEIANAVVREPGLWIAQSGIALEFLGALWIVVAAIRNKRRTKGIDNTWSGMDVERLAQIVGSQAITEFWGFVLLGTGLALQFIGGLPIYGAPA